MTAIVFLHESGHETPGTVLSPGVGPCAAAYLTVHIAPQDLRCPRGIRQQTQGITRQVARKRVLRTAGALPAPTP